MILNISNKSIIIVSGPTACGKTDLVYQLAEQMPIEIINADIGSMYKPLTIGTAKPDWKKSKIAHHGFDILDTPEQFSVVQFRALVQQLIKQIQDRNRIPVIVGGSTLYIKSLFFNTHDLADTKQNVSILYQQIQDKQVTNVDLWNQLNAQDPERAAKIHNNDTYRIVQALAICQVTNQKSSNFEQYFAPIAPFYWICCTRDRAELYDRINHRVHMMMDHGFLAEVAALQNSQWSEFLMKKKIIGYDDLLNFLSQEPSYDQVILQIQQKTRHYAKRQITFFKKLQQQVAAELTQKKADGQVCSLGL